MHGMPWEQVPWRALQSRPVVVELSDVWLCACPRSEEEWEEDLAGQRAKVCPSVQHAARTCACMHHHRHDMQRLHCNVAALSMPWQPG